MALGSPINFCTVPSPGFALPGIPEPSGTCSGEQLVPGSGDVGVTAWLLPAGDPGGVPAPAGLDPMLPGFTGSTKSTSEGYAFCSHCPDVFSVIARVIQDLICPGTGALPSAARSWTSPPVVTDGAGSLQSSWPRASPSWNSLMVPYLAKRDAEISTCILQTQLFPAYANSPMQPSFQGSYSTATAGHTARCHPHFAPADFEWSWLVNRLVTASSWTLS